MFKTRRGIIKTFFLSLITIGIYPLYLIHAASYETNETCKEDGKKTRGLILFIVFSLLTLMIYPIVWSYKIVNRWAAYIRRTKRHPRLTGGTFIMWSLLGALIGIGPFIAMYKYYKLWNEVNKSYNQKFVGESETVKLIEETPKAIFEKKPIEKPRALVIQAKMDETPVVIKPKKDGLIKAPSLVANRSFWLWLFLNIITLGIISLVMLNKSYKDLKITCGEQKFNDRNLVGAIVIIIVYFIPIIIGAVTLIALLGNIFPPYVFPSMAIFTIVYITSYIIAALLILVSFCAICVAALLVEKRAAFLRQNGQEEKLNSPLFILFVILTGLTGGVLIFIPLYSFIKQWNKTNKIYLESKGQLVTVPYFDIIANPVQVVDAANSIFMIDGELIKVVKRSSVEI